MSENVINVAGILVVQPVREGKNVKYQHAKVTVRVPQEWSLYHTWDGCHGVPLVTLDEDGILKIELKRNKPN